MYFFKHVLSLFVLVLPFFTAALISAPTAYAAACTHTYTSSAGVPTSYGAAYNLFTAAKELFVQGQDCTASSFTLKVGSTDGQYVYKQGYKWTSSGWELLTLNGGALTNTNWYTSPATATISGTLANGVYVVGYICQKVSDVWKCGCHDTACSTSYWQLQRVTAASGSGPVCGNGVCETGETTNTCSQDCRTAGTANVTINYASAASPGPLNHVAAGFLHGLATSNGGQKISPASLWTDLAPKYLRTWPTAIAPSYNEDKRLNGGTSNLTMVVVVSDGWKPANKPAPWGSDYNNPNYSAYLNYVVSMANSIKSSIPVGQRVYDFWNEPDVGHFYADWDAREASNGYPRFKELWVLFYKLFKEGLPGYNNGQALDPGAKITAPGTSAKGDGAAAGDTFTKDFMTYAIQHNAIPDYWNWHGGGAYYIDKLNARLNYARSLGGDRDALVLEYLMRGAGAIGQRPGAAIYEIAQMEQGASTPSQTGYKFATNARWPITTEAGNALFFDGGKWKKHGIWYAYADYAKMKGNRAILTSTWSTKVNAVVSIDTASKKAWALMGNEKIHTDGATVLGTLTTRASGIKSADASGKVYVTISRIPYDNFGEVTDAEVVKVIDNAAYTVTNNAIDVAFAWDRADNGYFMEISNVSPQ